MALPVAAGVGDPVLAGKTNQVDEQTRIKGDVDTPNLKLTNTNPDGMAASFNVEPGNPPFKVSSGEQVKLLNADRVDGKHIGAILTKAEYDDDKNGVVDDAEAVGGLTAGDIQALAGYPPSDRLVSGSATPGALTSAVPSGTVLTSITLSMGHTNGVVCNVGLSIGGNRVFQLSGQNSEYHGHVFEPGIVSAGNMQIQLLDDHDCGNAWAIWTGYTDAP